MHNFHVLDHQFRELLTNTSINNQLIYLSLLYGMETLVMRNLHTYHYITNFTRPTEYNNDNSKVFAKMSLPRSITVKETGRLVDIHISPVLIETEFLADGSLPVLPISTEIFTDDKYEKFNKLTYSIGKLNRLAESYLDRLQYFIRYYFHNKDYEEYVTANKKCSDKIEYNVTDNFSKLSFMQLKNLLSCIIKSDT